MSQQVWKFVRFSVGAFFLGAIWFAAFGTDDKGKGKGWSQRIQYMSIYMSAQLGVELCAEAVHLAFMEIV